MHSRTESVGPFIPVHITATAATAAPVGKNVSTTSATTIVASTMAVTPASMLNIVPGLRINVSGGTGAAEDTQVISTTSTTFTATFVNGHSGAYQIVSFRGVYFGRLVVNTVGTGAVFTFYNGSPLLYAGGTGTGTAFAVISPNAVVAGQFFYDAFCPRGLFYTLSGTPGDYTLTYVDDGS